MIIFDDFIRDDSRYIKNGESEYAFLNRCSLNHISQAREFVDSIAANYPAHELQELRARIRSGDNIHFKSSIFELLLHEALVRSGFTLDIHPELPNGSTKKPDFLVRTPDGEQFYLEAVLASEINEYDPSAESRKTFVINHLSANPHKHFIVSIESRGNPSTQPSAKKLLSEIHNWLDSLNPDDIQTLIDENGFDATPVYYLEHEHWSLIFKPIPLTPERRDQSTTLLGIFTPEASWVNAWMPIKSAIRNKGVRYGKLDKPYLVAVNHDSIHLSEIDEVQGLFGQEQYSFPPDSPEEAVLTRAKNGAWLGISGPEHTRVSGACYLII
jgi:hypothetical protein